METLNAPLQLKFTNGNVFPIRRSHIEKAIHFVEIGSIIQDIVKH